MSAAFTARVLCACGHHRNVNVARATPKEQERVVTIARSVYRRTQCPDCERGTD